MSLKSRLLWSLVRLAVFNCIMSVWEGLLVTPIVPGEDEPESSIVSSFRALTPERDVKQL